MMSTRAPSRARTIAVLASVVAAAVLLAGCIPGPSAHPERRYDDAAIDALTATLETGGVTVVAEPTLAALDAAPTVIVLSRGQVDSMTAQLAAGGGWTGAELDGFTEVPIEGPPLSFMLAGWARDYTGAGAQAARSLMGEQDWTVPDAIVWPEAVLSLLLADVTADDAGADAAAPAALGPTIATASLASPRLPALDVGALCSATADFVSGALARVHQAINRAAEAAAAAAERVGGKIFGGVIGSAIGWLVGAAVKLFNEVVQGILKAITTLLAPFILAVKAALVVISVVQSVAAAVRPWSLRITGDPSPIVAGDHEVPGRATLVGDALGPLDYPEWIRQCVGALGFTLPPRPGPGAAVSWTFQPAVGHLARETDHESVVDDAMSARLEYVVNAEPPERWGGKPFDLWIRVRAEVDQAKALEPLTEFAKKLISGQLAKLPAPLTAVLGELMSSMAGQALDALAEAIARSTAGSVQIPFVYHDIKDDKKSPSAPAPPPQLEMQAHDFCVVYAEELGWMAENEMTYWTEYFETHAGDEDSVPTEYLAHLHRIWAAAPGYLKSAWWGWAGSPPSTDNPGWRWAIEHCPSPYAEQIQTAGERIGQNWGLR